MISAFGMCRDESLQISLAFYEADHVEVFVSMVTREYTFSIETKPWHRSSVLCESLNVFDILSATGSYQTYPHKQVAKKIFVILVFLHI